MENNFQENLKYKCLDRARSVKNDEFYTLYEDVEKELVHYENQLKDKIVYCNCDSYTSNFVKYFRNNFGRLGLKKLIATSYGENGGYLFEKTKFGESETPLNGNGSFDSDECIEILKVSDFVITNPPFSLFREYVKTMMKYEKKFLVICNMNSCGYKEIFPYIMDNKLWWGISLKGTKCSFEVPNDYEGNNTYIKDGKKYGRVNNSIWLTNIENNKVVEPLKLTKSYNENDYKKYDNYNGIECPKVQDIPYDYDGVIGVPITFLGKHCKEQFKIVGFRKGDDGKDLKVNGKDLYSRILIKKMK